MTHSDPARTSLPFSEWSAKEYRTLFRALLVPPPKATIPGMCRAFEAVLQGHPVLPVSRAAAGLWLALRVFRTRYPERKNVIVPAYLCPIVFQAIAESGLQAVPVDVGHDLNLDPQALERALSVSTLAVVVAHMYGCPANIRDIVERCRKRGVFVIDDAAQAFGVEYSGQPLGTFGDAGMVSFGQSKPIVAGSVDAGGLLVINNPDLEDDLRAAWEVLPEPHGYRADISRFLWEYQWRRWTELPSYAARRILGLASSTRRSRFRAAKINRLSAALAMAQLESLPRRIEGRRQVARQYYERLARYPELEFLQYAPERFLARILLVLPEQLNTGAIRKWLRDRGIRTRLGYPVYSAHAVTPPVKAVSIRRRLIELPSHSLMGGAEIDKVLAAVAEAARGC